MQPPVVVNNMDGMAGDMHYLIIQMNLQVILLVNPKQRRGELFRSRI